MQRPRFDDEFRDLAAVAYRVAYRILGNRPAAEDIAQESLARAYQRWARISEYRQAWVARVAPPAPRWFPTRRSIAPV